MDKPDAKQPSQQPRKPGFLNAEKLKKEAPRIIKIVIAIGIIVFLYFYWGFIFRLVYEQFFDGKPVESFLPSVLKILTLVIGTEIFLMISRFVISKYLEINRKKREAKIVLNLYTYLVWLIVGIIIIASFFENVGALLTSIGLIGFGITFALQKPILNFVGWLTISLNNPFSVGDRIEVSGIRGDVLSIHTMYTRVIGTRVDTHERSEKIITLPNEFILTNAVINYSKEGELYSDEVNISITYESNWKKAMEILERVTLNTIKKYLKKEAPATIAERRAWQEAIKLLQEASKKIKKGLVKDSVKENIDILKGAETAAEAEIPKPNIQLALGESSINLNVVYQTDLREVRATKHEIVRGFMEEVEKTKDIEIAYPHVQIVVGDKTKQRAGKGKDILSYLGQNGENQ